MAVDDSRKPWFVYPLLALAVLAVSSAGPTFATMQEIPPFLLSAWRLSMTAMLLIPLGLYQIFKLSPDERSLMLRQSPLIISAGVLLCFHYGAWVESIQSTSLAHAVLLVSTSPIFIALGTWILRKPISCGELIGTAVAVVGLGIMTATSGAAGSEREATVYGDVVGLAAAVTFVFYLMIGRSLRRWMPIFAYVLPVNAVAALALSVCAILIEGAKFDASKHGLLGAYSHWTYLWRCVYMAAIPGILGHVSFNALLRWLHPLLIALPGVSEAPLGILLGVLLGSGSVPGISTFIGGAILVVATVAVIICSYRREKMEVDATQAWAAAISKLDLEMAAELGDLAADHDEDSTEESLHLIESAARS